MADGEAGDYGFTRDAEPYPNDAGVSMRMLRMPVGRPGSAPAPRRAKRRNDDGRAEDCDVMATLGQPRRGPVAPDDQVRDWRPVA